MIKKLSIYTIYKEQETVAKNNVVIHIWFIFGKVYIYFDFQAPKTFFIAD